MKKSQAFHPLPARGGPPQGLPLVVVQLELEYRPASKAVMGPDDQAPKRQRPAERFKRTYQDLMYPPPTCVIECWLWFAHSRNTGKEISA
jgi:hypothetical protein